MLSMSLRPGMQCYNIRGYNVCRYRSERESRRKYSDDEKRNYPTFLKWGSSWCSWCSWYSRVVLITKKNSSIRFCVDYRCLNKITKNDVDPMPSIDDVLRAPRGAIYFSSLDLRFGCWQTPMAEEGKQKTAFVTPDSLYKFNIMPFSISNAAARFENMIDTVLHGLKRKVSFCYLDDVACFHHPFLSICAAWRPCVVVHFPPGFNWIGRKANLPTAKSKTHIPGHTTHRRDDTNRDDEM